jgi:hypothetical protein
MKLKLAVPVKFNYLPSSVLQNSQNICPQLPLLQWAVTSGFHGPSPHWHYTCVSTLVVPTLTVVPYAKLFRHSANEVIASQIKGRLIAKM